MQNAPNDKQIDAERLFKVLYRNGLIEPVLDTNISDRTFTTTKLGNSLLGIMRALTFWMVRSGDEMSEARRRFDSEFEVVEIEN